MVARGNHKADQEAKVMASNGATEPMAPTAILFPSLLAKWDPSYSMRTPGLKLRPMLAV